MAALNGIHHISAITGDPQRNVDFYTTVLGQRMVKKTVNLDDPGTYRLYYGDETGTPGTLLTFFAWTGARRGRQGAGQTGAIVFAVPPGSLDGTPIFIGCDDADPHVPAARVAQPAQVLTDLGAPVTARFYPRMGHTVNQDELDTAQAMLRALLDMPQP